MLIEPGTHFGKHPDSGVLHKLTITLQGVLRIERQPYVSSNADGWTQEFRIIEDDPTNRLWLILKIKQNPIPAAMWPK